MKRTLLVLFMASAVIVSCSTDKEDASSRDSLVGTWAMSSVIPGNVADVDEAEMDYKTKPYIDLIASDCQLLVITFNEDGSQITENKVNYIMHDFDGEKIVFSCPTQKDTNSGSWSLDGNSLTITDKFGNEEQATVKMEGNTFSVSGDDLGDVNLAETKVIFTKR